MNHDAVAPNVAWAAIAAVCVLVVSTFVRLVALRHQPPDIAGSRIRSLKTWWVVTGAVVGAALLGPIAIISLSAVVSLLSLREYSQHFRSSRGFSGGCSGQATW